MSSKSIGWITLNVLGKISTRSILTSLWDIRIKKKKSPRDPPCAHWDIIIVVLLVLFLFLVSGLESYLPHLGVAQWFWSCFWGVGLKFETQPQLTMWHCSTQELYLPTPKITRSLGEILWVAKSTAWDFVGGEVDDVKFRGRRRTMVTWLMIYVEDNSD